MAEPEKNFTTLNNDVSMHYDSTVIGNPEWLTIPEAAQMLELGDRQVRNKCKEFSWDKRYAKVEGRPVAYLKKSDVAAYRRTRGPFTTHEEGQVISENAGETAAVHTEHLHESTPETGMKPYKSTPEEITTLLAGLENRLTPQIASFVETHKKVVEELTIIQQKNTGNEKQVTFWRTSMFWLLGISIVLVGSLGWLWLNTTERAGELAKSNTELSGSLTTAQKDLYEAKLRVSEKENDLLRLKNAAQAAAQNQVVKP